MQQKIVKQIYLKKDVGRKLIAARLHVNNKIEKERRF